MARMLPEIVSREEFEAARARLLAKEKAATRTLDALAAERRRQPMVRVAAGYVFDGPAGETTLLELFEGCRQLIVYHFMGTSPDPEPCGGCSSFTDNVPNLVHLSARDTRYVVISRHEVQEQQHLRARFGWDVPFYSAARNRFTEELGVGGGFALSVFFRDGGDVYRSYWTSGRGVDRLRMDFSLLDLTPFGRQEEWEDSPEGWPQTPTMRWLRRNDEY
jgi:predicted dithiol-disulfide oxidoreductase (DUF899 family)